MRWIAAWILAAVGVHAASAQEFLNSGLDNLKSKPNPSAVATNDRVGEYGDPRSVRISGAQAFSGRAIKDALFADQRFLLAAHPAAPKSGYLRALQEGVEIGYRHAGFLNIKASADIDKSIDSMFVVVSLKEGDRYRCGDVRVIGARNVPVDRLVRRLTEPYLSAEAASDPDNEDDHVLRASESPAAEAHSSDSNAPKPESPVWPKGKPAPFDSLTYKKLHEQVKEALADVGFHFPKFSINVMPNLAKKTADLVVTISREGPPDVIDEIEVSGHRRDKMDEILDYLHARPGMRFDRAERARIERLLWHSGRYKAYKVQVVEREGGQGLKLQLDLKEYLGAPKISESLSREEQTLLKARKWLTGANRHRSDMLFTMEKDGHRLETILSSQRGGLATVRPTEKDRPPIHLALATTNREFAFWDLIGKKKFAVPLGSAHATIEVELGLNEGNEAEGPFHLRVGMGIHYQDEDEPDGGLKIRFQVSPAYFVALAHEHEARCAWKNSRLVLSSSYDNIEIDGSTGRILRWTAEDKDRLSTLEIKFADGVFQQRMDEIEKASAGFKNAYDPRRPCHSIIQTLWNDESLWRLYELGNRENKEYDPRIAKQVRQIGRSLLEHDVLAPIDEWVLSASQTPQVKEEDKFSLPTDSSRAAGSDLQKLLAQLPAWSLRAADRLFPRESWPWTLSREMTLGWAGHKEFTASELRRLADSRDMGPLGYLCTARLLRLFELDGYQAVAGQGLKRLTAADFRKDYRALLPPDRIPATVVHHVAETLRGMKARDVKFVSQAWLNDRAVLLESLARELRAHRDKPIPQALEALLDQYWETTLRAEAKSLLRELAEERR
jgi:hypothetical protein